ncbi:uncharacterized protein DDB_G0290685-like [Megalops cyprinoides]|uniref:uncharacterized protein DDB_G0290685-like n=1 Tax=Megalops cyprinoides TaxID=118141 RepID=UPI00186403EE|nr:uncharacterized protein DDB_G0290685-like [Megalops cyprinoides]
MSTKPNMPSEGTQHMDSPQTCMDTFEIYVPKDAGVTSVPAQTLPPTIVKKMGPFSTPTSPDGSSMMVTCISPVVVREKGSHARVPVGSSDGARDRLTTAAASCTSPSVGQKGQCWLPVACSNWKAFRVLQEFMSQDSCCPQEGEGAVTVCSPAPLLHGHPLCFSQDSIIIHRGRIFLSIMKAAPGQKSAEQGPTPDALPQQPTPCALEGRETVSDSSKPPPPPDKLQPTHSSPQAERAPGLRALEQRFGITRKVQVTLPKLPDPTLKRLRSAGQVRSGNQKLIGQLCNVAEQQKSSLKSRRSAGLSRESPCSRGSKGQRAPAHDRDKEVQGAELEEPITKKARLAPPSQVYPDKAAEERDEGKRENEKSEGGDSVEGVAEGGDSVEGVAEGGDSGECVAEGGESGECVAEGGDSGECLAEGGESGECVAEGGDSGECVAEGGDSGECVAEGRDSGECVPEGGDSGECVAEGGDSGWCVAEGGDSGECVAEGGDSGECVAEGGDSGECVAEGGDSGECVVEGGDSGECVVEGGDSGECVVEGRDSGECVVEGGDCEELGTEDGDLSEVDAEGRDLSEAEVKGGDLSEIEVQGGDVSRNEGADGGSRGRSQEVSMPSYLAAPSLRYATEFDFEQSAREEKISRIRARLREKEAALRNLRPPD